MKSSQIKLSIDTPYYIGRLVAALNEGLPCDIEEHVLQALQTTSYMKTVKPPTEIDIGKLRITISKPTLHRKTLVLDLDETLIHCN
jgi:hypothetical protein